MASNNPLHLSDIPTLPTLYTKHHLSPSPNPTATPNQYLNAKISLIRTDITALATTAIVNAANTSLLGGGGVDGAIHRAAGPGLLAECRTLDGCDTGAAKITRAYDLPCDHVIHAVGPVYWAAKREGGEEGPARLLAGCYTTALDLLDGVGGGSVAFSALSTGVYGYPSGEAAEVAVGAVRGWLEADEARAARVERVVFCAFLEKDERAYEEGVPKFFPPGAEDVEEQRQTEDTAASTDGAADSTGTIESAAATSTSDETTVGDLPDVPTEEPKEPGQPELKKAKLDDEGQK